MMMGGSRWTYQLCRGLSEYLAEGISACLCAFDHSCDSWHIDYVGDCSHARKTADDHGAYIDAWPICNVPGADIDAWPICNVPVTYIDAWPICNVPGADIDA